MADYEVVDADIWVGSTPPVAPGADDFWFDTSKVPLFGIDIEGSLPGAGPPPSDGASGGEAWWDSDGNLWVWNGSEWTNMGNFQGPAGPAGPTGPSGAAGPAGPPGAPGESLDVKGELAAPSELPLNPELNDSYVIGGDLFIWNGSSWVTVPFVGPAGPTGPAGPPLSILGTLPDAGPPAQAGSAPGDAWIGSDGSLWVWDGSKWSPVASGGGGTGGGLPPGGAVGELLVKTGTADGAASWTAAGSIMEIRSLQAQVASLEAVIAAMKPAWDAWVATADWSVDGSVKY